MEIRGTLNTERYYFTRDDSLYWRHIRHVDTLKTESDSVVEEDYYMQFSASGIESETIEPPFLKSFRKNKPLSHCYFCKSELKDIFEQGDRGRPGFWRQLHKYYCDTCGWWLIIDIDESNELPWITLERITVTEGIVKRFNVNTLDAPIKVLRQHLIKNQKDFFLLHPTMFEKLVEAVYRDYFQCEVKHAGGPGDGGVDLYAVIADEPHIVQVKRRENLQSKESVRVVREFIGAMILQDVQKGHILTTAADFTKPAKEAAQSVYLKRDGVDIQLKSLKEFRTMLNLSTKRNDNPFSGYV